jgi:hypothetical protein
MNNKHFTQEEINLIKKYFKLKQVEMQTGSHRTYIYKVLKGEVKGSTEKAKKVIRTCSDLLAEAQYNENGLK